MDTANVWMLSLVLCWGLPSQHTTLSSAAVYYVTPHSPNPNCHSGEPCLTINEYAQESHFDGDDNITLLFLNGEHNLTTQKLEIHPKVTFKMAPIANISKPKVLVQFCNGTSIEMLNILEAEITEIEFFTESSEQALCTSPCLLFSDVSLISTTRVSIKSCQLFLQGDFEVMATVAELSTNMSCIALVPGVHLFKITVTIRNSVFHSSIINGSDYFTSNAPSGHIMPTNGLKLAIESSSMYNSFVEIKLLFLTQFYKLSIFNSTITSLHNNILTTGVIVEVYNSASMHVNIDSCSIIGNYQGVRIKAGGSSHLELSVDQCEVVDNRHLGIQALQNESSTAVINITASTLSNNEFGQFAVSSGSFSTVTKVNMFNSTIKNTHQFHYPDGSPSSGADFNLSGKYFTLNLTQNFFETNANEGVHFSAGKCEGQHGIYFNRNTVISNYYGLNVSSVCAVNITDCLFINNSVSMHTGYNTSLHVIVKNSTFTCNKNGLIVGSYLPLHLIDATSLSVVVEDSIFVENIGLSLEVSYFESRSANSIIFYVQLKNVTFYNNTNLLSNGGIVQVNGGVSLSVEDSCVFKGNHGTPIKAYYASSITLSGLVIFEDNAAYQGGAISMSFSMLRFKSVNGTNTNILFINNTAERVGGSIFVEQSVISNWYLEFNCFFDAILGVSFEQIKHSLVNVTLGFNNNTAAKGGMEIYGASPKTNECPVSLDDGIWSGLTSSDVQQYLFKIPSGISSISSDPSRVCLCESSSQLMCKNLSYIFYNTTHYPGEVFSLNLAVVGFEFGTVFGLVYATLLPHANSSTAFLESGQYVRQFKNYKACKTFDFTVISFNSEETIVLTTTGNMIHEEKIFSEVKLPTQLLIAPVYIIVTLKDCPPGFERTEGGKCDCIEKLKRIGITDCSIVNNKSYIVRSGNQWIKQESNSFLYSNNCPLDYCDKESLSIDLKVPDKQCAANRIGKLCGACSSNFSLAIGSSRCMKCPDNYSTLLLIAFIVAGVVVVMFIKVLDVTVATGTINGLILYANIIWTNQSVFFPPQNKENGFSMLQFLKIFTAWINLDLGIETCFIRYLDGYTKTWLQFVFPLYIIWLIAGVIILVSHYSIRATRLLGNTSVSVLATLLLLSYSKMLRTVVAVIQFAFLESSDGPQLVWSFDGNVPYFGIAHSIQLAVTLVFILILLLPYTLVLFFVHYLRKYSHLPLLNWVNRLKPFFDSYLGPLKDRHHYWIGLGLLARFVLLITSAATLTTLPFITPLIVAVVTTLLCLLVLNVYKQWQLSVLESVFLINMTIFCLGVLFIEAQGGSKYILACFSLGLAFFLFVAIIGFHLWKRVKALLKQLRNRQNGYENIDLHPQDLSRAEHSLMHQDVPVPEFRESLLEDSIM